MNLSHHLTVFILLLTALFLSYPAKAADEPGKLPLMTTVFEKQRSTTEDVIYFRNNDVLRGKVINSSLSISTPYGQISLSTDRCAGVSFEGSRANTEAIVTVNWNRITGIIGDRTIRFKIGSSGAEIPIRKEKIRFIAFRKKNSELSFIDFKKKIDLFIMTNGDLLTGHAADPNLKIQTDYGIIPVSFSEIASVQMQGGDNVTAVITKRNKDIMRGTLATEEITLNLDVGAIVEAIYKDKFARIHVTDGATQVTANYGVLQPIQGESEGAAFAGVAGATITNSIGMKMILIKPGEFMMGSPPDEESRDDDEPQQKVKLTRGFYMGITEVTQAQWKAVMSDNPSNFKGDSLPVETVSWNDAVAFCEKLSKKEKKKYRLPTEAEWEYVCRAGTTTPFSTGDTISTSQANYDGDYTYGSGSKGTDREQTVPVASFKPNDWGLYDMHGNVWEWCSDWYGKYPQVTITNPMGATRGEFRVLRGGSWNYIPEYCRSAARSRTSPGTRFFDYGFRVVLDLK